MAWISFWADVASEMVYPVIPLFVVGALKAPGWALGGMEGLANVLLNFVRGWSGRWSDRIGKRLPFVRTGYGLTAISKPLMALAYAWPVASTARIADRFGKGLRNTARDALLADATEGADAGRAFGFHRTMDAAGAVFGSLCGFLLLTYLPGKYRLIFAITAVPGLVAVWLTFLLKEAHPRALAEEAAKRNGDPAPQPEVHVSIPAMSSRFKRVLAVSLLFGLANSSDMFLLLRARDLGFSDGMVVLAYALFNLVYSVSAYPLGKWSDKIGRKSILAIGWTVYAVTYFAFANTPAWGVWPLLALYGLYNGACDGTSKAWVRDASDPENRGSAMGYYAMGTGFAGLAASVGAGILWDKVGHAAPFWVGGSLAALALIALPFAKTGSAS